VTDKLLTDPWFDAYFIVDAPGSPEGSFKRRRDGILAGAHGLFLWCPCAYGNNGRAHGLIVPFVGAPAHNFLVRARAGGGFPKWAVNGTSLADLSCLPSIDVGTLSCWHGFITAGVVKP
jgi:hypothetical protein